MLTVGIIEIEIAILYVKLYTNLIDVKSGH